MMNDKYQNKYRIPPARAQWWDYGSNGAYFVTICTRDHKCFFGEIIEQQMQLSHVGLIADIFWHEIKKHSDCVKPDAFVVMPNHIHGIIVIDKPDDDDSP
jgi:REP element-mobilizing transposase RayT